MSTIVKPDYKSIAWKLMRQCEFALQKLKADNWTGMLFNSDDPDGTRRHWKDDMADVMELLPGIKVDREAMHACSLPKKQRDKFFADRKAKTQPAAPAA